MVELVCGRSVINGAYPVKFHKLHMHEFGRPLKFPVQENLVCVSCRSDLDIIVKAKKRDIPVMAQNWLVTAVLCYVFDQRLTVKC